MILKLQPWLLQEIPAVHAQDVKLDAQDLVQVHVLDLVQVHVLDHALDHVEEHVREDALAAVKLLVLVLV